MLGAGAFLMGFFFLLTGRRFLKPPPPPPPPLLRLPPIIGFFSPALLRPPLTIGMLAPQTIPPVRTLRCVPAWRATIFIAVNSLRTRARPKACAREERFSLFQGVDMRLAATPL